MHNEILKRLDDYQKIIIDKTGLRCFGTVLYGSQNYNLHSIDSDIDAVCLVLPDDPKDPIRPFEYIVLDSGEQINICDIRAVLLQIIEGSTLFIELLYSDYYLIDPQFLAIWQKLKDKKEEIVKENIGGFLQGLQKNCDTNIQYFVRQVGQKNLQTKEHYYVKPVIHMVRVKNIIHHILNKNFKNLYIFDGDKELILSLKKGDYSFKEAESLLFSVYKDNSLAITKHCFYYGKSMSPALEEWIISIVQEILFYNRKK